MQKFKFELQDVLQFRQFEQQQAEIELGKALAAEKEVQDKLDQLAQQLAETKRLMKGSSDFYAIADANRFSTFVKTQSEYLMNQMAELKLVSDQKREVLKGCMQKVNALEKLKEKQLEDWKQQENQEEEDFADDIVTGQFNRK